jgi:hypothetical protein
MRLQFEAHIEVIFDRRFPAPGHDHDLIASRRQCLFNPILDDRLVHQRQHFLRNRFRRWQKTGAETRCRKIALRTLVCVDIALL